MNTIAILGGGASGLAAAIAACEQPGNTVILLERQARVGKKLLATGNGRCNLTNENAGPAHYHGADVGFMTPALRRFGVADTLRWFAGLGLSVRTEPGGRIYPLSDTAGSVLDTLRLAADAAGAQLICGFDAASVRMRRGHFTVTPHEGDPVTADKLIIACGGMAGSKLGGTESGYTLLEQLGHKRTKLYPSLMQLNTENTYTRSLKGVRTQAKVTLEGRGRVLAKSFGEVQFADYGLTGPAIFDLSRTAAQCGGGCEVILRLVPELSSKELSDYIYQKRSRFPDYHAENLFTGLMHNSIARVLLRRTELRQDAPLKTLTDAQISALSSLIRRFSLPLQGVHGFADAQVTAGGMETSAFDPNTMESRIVPGLYACGEVLDIDGDCGGYNLQWAWSSGRLAGLSAAGGDTK